MYRRIRTSCGRETSEKDSMLHVHSNRKESFTLASCMWKVSVLGMLVEL
jgi:hypothetical protein